MPGRSTVIVAIGVLLSAPVASAQNPNTPQELPQNEPKNLRAVETAIATKVVQWAKESGHTLRVIREKDARVWACSISEWVEADAKATRFAGGNNVDAIETPDDMPRSISKAARTPESYWTRFSIGAWYGTDSEHPNGTYHITIRFHGNPFAEWINDHLTDEMYYKDRWKKDVSKRCLHVPY